MSLLRPQRYYGMPDGSSVGPLSRRDERGREGQGGGRAYLSGRHWVLPPCHADSLDLVSRGMHRNPTRYPSLTLPSLNCTQQAGGSFLDRKLALHSKSKALVVDTAPDLIYIPTQAAGFETGSCLGDLEGCEGSRPAAHVPVASQSEVDGCDAELLGMLGDYLKILLRGVQRGNAPLAGGLGVCPFDRLRAGSEPAEGMCPQRQKPRGGGRVGRYASFLR